MKAVIYELYLHEERQLTVIEESLDGIRDMIDDRDYITAIGFTQEIKILINDINPLRDDNILLRALDITIDAYGRHMDKIKKQLVGE